MKVIICGAGQVGWQIARHLANEKNDVTIIDNDADLVRRATDTLDVQGLAGFASYPNVLERAGAEDADMVIAATHSDEVNMVTCQVAHSVFSVPRKIARLRAQGYLNAIYSDLFRRDHLPIDVVISPEREVAVAALRRLQTPAAFETEFFLGEKAQLIGIRIDDDCPVANTPLRELSNLFSTLRAIVVGIRRNGELIVPDAGGHVEPGDAAYVFAHLDDVDRTLEAFGKRAPEQKRVVVVGGGNVGLAVAKNLEDQPGRIRSKVIERSRPCAERAAEELEKTIVLHGDGLDVDLLREAKIENSDAVLAVTDDDKTNILAAVRSKALGCKMSICLINDPTLVPLLDELDIDAHINPRATTVSSILRHIRQGKVTGVYTIGDDDAEVIEAVVLSSSNIAGKKISDIDFPEGVLVGAMKKGSEVIIPRGRTLIEEGDSLVLFSLSKNVQDVERLLQVTIDFF